MDNKEKYVIDAQDIQDELQERMAIIEFDGKLPRAIAEEMALKQMREKYGEGFGDVKT